MIPLLLLISALAGTPAIAKDFACEGWKPLFALPAATFTPAPQTRLWLIGDLHGSAAVAREAWEMSDRIRKLLPKAKGCVFTELPVTYQRELDSLAQGKSDFPALMASIAVREYKATFADAMSQIKESGRDRLETTPTHWWQAMHEAGLRVLATDHAQTPHHDTITAENMQLRNAHIARVIAEEFKSGRCEYGIGFYGLDHLTQGQKAGKLQPIGENLKGRVGPIERVLIVSSNEDEYLTSLVPPHCLGPWLKIPDEYRTSSSRLVSPKGLPPASLWSDDSEYQPDGVPRVGEFDWVVLAK